ncbi:MAG: hypothetical protein JRI25_19505 [Deltaproteobacteria bacterium]|nr:hypothetical protein [Deltaproteobacteria bacterium]
MLCRLLLAGLLTIAPFTSALGQAEDDSVVPAEEPETADPAQDSTPPPLPATESGTTDPVGVLVADLHALQDLGYRPLVIAATGVVAQEAAATLQSANPDLDLRVVRTYLYQSTPEHIEKQIQGESARCGVWLTSMGGSFRSLLLGECTADAETVATLQIEPLVSSRVDFWLLRSDAVWFGRYRRASGTAYAGLVLGAISIVGTGAAFLAFGPPGFLLGILTGPIALAGAPFVAGGSLRARRALKETGEGGPSVIAGMVAWTSWGVSMGCVVAMSPEHSTETFMRLARAATGATALSYVAGAAQLAVNRSWLVQSRVSEIAGSVARPQLRVFPMPVREGAGMVFGLAW